MLFVSLAERSRANFLKELETLTHAEIRIDSSELSAQDVATIFETKKDLIATCRPNEKIEDSKRTELLIAAIRSGAKYVDLEYDAPSEHFNSVFECAEENGCKVIVSVHDYDHTPPQSILKQIASECFIRGADIAKIACMANSPRDSARLLSLLCEEQPIVPIGMGKMGRVTRVAATLLGAPLTYAAKDQTSCTAPGQLPLEELQKLLLILDPPDERSN
jgi:3-dehydroquinate dehydratase-1